MRRGCHADFYERVNAPILGICYGMQMIAVDLGGKNEPAARREYGHAQLKVLSGATKLFTGLPFELDVWMSHGDHVTELPAGFYTNRDDRRSGDGDGKRRAAASIACSFTPRFRTRRLAKRFCGIFCSTFAIARAIGHPHNLSPKRSKRSAKLSDRTTRSYADFRAAWIRPSPPSSFTKRSAIGKPAFSSITDCFAIANFEDTLTVYNDNLHLNVRGVDASQEFYAVLKDVVDPEKKRKAIGAKFIDIFDAEAQKIGDVKWLVQGTLYPDVIESVSLRGSSVTIKTHHNVGGLPEKMNLKLIEPLRELFKDEVRLIGRDLGIPEMILERHPFPGPGLGVRILGDITPEKVELLQKADRIFIEELHNFDLYKDVWQAFAVLLPIQSVGVMGDFRTYEKTVALRAVTSTDGMTADWARLPHDFLAEFPRGSRRRSAA